YHGETRELLETIRLVARRLPIVLPRTIGFDASGRYYVLESDFHDESGLCPPFSSSASLKIVCGYIALPDDMRLLPPSLVLGNGQQVMSFAVAVARTRRLLP